MATGFEATLQVTDKVERSALTDRNRLFEDSYNPTDGEIKTASEAKGLPGDNQFLPNVELVDSKEPKSDKKATEKEEKKGKEKPCSKNRYGKNYDMDSTVDPDTACRIRNWVMRQFR